MPSSPFSRSSKVGYCDPHFGSLPELGPLLEFLWEDERPTIIIDTTKSIRENSNTSSCVVFENGAFSKWIGASDQTPHVERWLTEIRESFTPTQKEQSLTFEGRRWSIKELRHEWKIIHCSFLREQSLGTNRSKSLENGSVTQHALYHGASGWHDRDEYQKRVKIDWIRWPEVSSNAWTRFLTGFAWETTCLGPMSEWPDVLCRLAVMIMACPDPRMIYYGEQQAILYNEAAAAILGKCHPGSLGQRFLDVWSAEIHARHLDMVHQAIVEGKATQAKSFEAIIDRNGYMEETYWNIHLLPIAGDDGHILAALNEYFEVTDSVFQHQRQKLVARINEHTALAETLPELWSLFLTDLGDHLFDLSYVLMYSAIKGSENVFRYEGCIGSCNPAYRSEIDITIGDTPEPSLARALHESRTLQQVIAISVEDGTLPDELAVPFGDRGDVHTACVFPITSLSGQLLAFLVLGLNPRRAYDEEMKLFVDQLRFLLCKFAGMISLPEEQRRDYQRYEEINFALSQQLRITALKAEKNEETFTRMANNSPIGWFMYSASGEPRFVNQAYLDLLGLTRKDLADEAATGLAWRNTIADEDIEYIAGKWREIFETKVPLKFEYRVKTPEGPNGEPPGVKWMEAIVFPELDDNGKAVTIQGWLTDINLRKLSETLMAQRLEDALETKRANERFMDMTSHEMRNPLSAILQLADEIRTLMPVSDGQTPVTTAAETANAIVDAADTIMLCAQHQKNIVDDVLTISKLDSNLLVIHPDRVNTPDLIMKAFKMYESEILRANIHTTIDVQKSYKDLAIDTVMLDPSRLLQVIINLLTNAVKFTRDSERRQIIVHLSASMLPPTGEDLCLQYIPHRPKHNVSPKMTTGEWGSGEEIYLQIAVEDSGRGISDEEMKLLFHRFSQASPKTYKQYGGSGLGLFISRELTELQGGQIGVYSKAGVGSTFCFYVKARRAVDEPNSRQYEPQKDMLFPEALRPITNALEPLRNSMAMETNHTTESAKIAPEDIHVLLVEDNAINRKVMSQQLRRLGCTVHTAEHGQDALAFLETTSFYPTKSGTLPVPLSIVLMDLEMPVMDGLTCVRLIRELQNTTNEIKGHIPVIAVTANARHEQMNTALEAGMDEVVTKPFRIPNLLPRMQALVARYTDVA